MYKNLNQCLQQCEYFRCGQKAINFLGKKVYCRWADDDCAGSSCNYAICVRGRLLSNGVCGLKIKRKTREDFDSSLEKGLEIKLKGKILKKFKKDDFLM